MSALDQLLKALEEGEAVNVVPSFTGDHLRLVADRLTVLAKEVDAGSKTYCCGQGVAIYEVEQPDGGIGTQIQINLHFSDVVHSGEPRH